MIKRLRVTQTIEEFGHATDFQEPEFTIVPTLDGYWVQGFSRAMHLPKNICMPVFEGSNVPIPEWIGRIVPEVEETASADADTPFDKNQFKRERETEAAASKKRGAGLVSP